MSVGDRRLFSAFFLGLSERPAAGDVAGFAAAAGVESLRDPGWCPPENPCLVGQWADLDCEASLLPLVVYDVLLVTYREQDFRSMWDPKDEERPVAAEAALDAFAHGCDALSPVAALAASYAWTDPGAYLAEVEQSVLGGFVGSLLREHVWLLFLAHADLETARSIAPLMEVRDVAGGAVLELPMDRSCW